MNKQAELMVGKSVKDAAFELARWLPNDLMAMASSAKSGEPVDADAIRHAADTASFVAELLTIADSLTGGDEA